jgi:hypothetical protein
LDDTKIWALEELPIRSMVGSKCEIQVLHAILIWYCVSISGILSDSIFFLLTLWKFLQTARVVVGNNLRVGSITGLRKWMPTVFLFFRDGSFYFFVVLGAPPARFS